MRDGRLGRLHTVRAVTSDPAPPPAAYLPLSGGLYRDCLVHDFDILRWVTGREVSEVYATGSDTGPAMFREAGDVDTASGPAHPRRRDARHRHRDPVQRRRVRRTDGAGRRTLTRSPSASTTVRR